MILNVTFNASSIFKVFFSFQIPLCEINRISKYLGVVLDALAKNELKGAMSLEEISGSWFQIRKNDISVTNFGVDLTAEQHLSETLLDIGRFNGLNCSSLRALYSAGDGSCLLNAISRTLCGIELFSHNIRLRLSSYLQTNLQRLKVSFLPFAVINDILM